MCQQLVTPQPQSRAESTEHACQRRAGSLCLEWCLPQWTSLPTLANKHHNLALRDSTPTGQPDLDNPSLGLSPCINS